MKKLILYYHTIRYLKPVQIRYRLYYFLRNRFLPFRLQPVKEAQVISSHLQLMPFIPGLPRQYQKVDGRHQFTFLNKSTSFHTINWNYPGYGKLWTYNLNYFEFLKDIKDPAEGTALIKDFIDELPEIKDGLEPYPLSLRIINWIKFLVLHQINDQTINRSLYQQIFLLTKKLEYHLLANHLLENGFALLFGSYYFRQEVWYQKGRNIMLSELNEQVLPDGAHFERSPMYHSIILYRLLDSFNLITQNQWKQDLKALISEKARTMLGWLNWVKVDEHQFPLFNDAAYGIAPSQGALKRYAEQLGLNAVTINQGGESGFRKLVNNDLLLIANYGSITPRYQPGHAHADTFNFELYHKRQPIIVDTGTSTYEIGERRSLEKSTLSHNTVAYGGKNSSEVWNGFRVGRRANVNWLKDHIKMIAAEHDGYKRAGIVHNRRILAVENGIEIVDTITGNARQSAIGLLHFHPNVNLEESKDELILNDYIRIFWTGIDSWELISYQYAPEFNKLIEAKKWMGKFRNESIIRIVRMS